MSYGSSCFCFCLHLFWVAWPSPSRGRHITGTSQSVSSFSFASGWRSRGEAQHRPIKEHQLSLFCSRLPLLVEAAAGGSCLSILLPAHPPGTVRSLLLPVVPSRSLPVSLCVCLCASLFFSVSMVGRGIQTGCIDGTNTAQDQAYHMFAAHFELFGGIVGKPKPATDHERRVWRWSVLKKR